MHYSVASIAAGVNVGVASWANIVSVKVLRNDNSARGSRIVDALNDVGEAHMANREGGQDGFKGSVIIMLVISRYSTNIASTNID